MGIFTKKADDFPFQKGTPESVGIKTEEMIAFYERLADYQIPMHSVLISRHDTLVTESYYAPFAQNTRQRMFSVTKSLVGLAIGILEGQGLCKRTDHIVDYFPEYVAEIPKNADGTFVGKYSYLQELTIEQMLTMRTCHAKTTYVHDAEDDWVRTFFVTEPSHKPGTVFNYDTSSSHVLCALVVKLTGKPMFSWMREQLLDEIGWSKEAKVLSNAYGQEIGGSGLCATPRDLMRLMNVLRQNGMVHGRQVIPKDYVEAAISKQVETDYKMDTIEERQGYGYQLWRTRYDGYCFYGMGGQYAVHYPAQDLLLVTTADTQGCKNSGQFIFEAFYETILRPMMARKNVETLPEANKEEYKRMQGVEHGRMLLLPKGNTTSPILTKVNKVRYVMEENSFGYRWVSIEIDGITGCMDYENQDGVGSLPFSMGENEVIQFPKYKIMAASSAAWVDRNTLEIRVQLMDDQIGNVILALHFSGDDLVVQMRKFEETLLKEFNTIITGHKE
ncbi:MAG: beta-lactamase family protein [Lachnospiraceae bacterium]|nr:beta-lactamase family protein [Lachnospiraceae bacterium]